MKKTRTQIITEIAVAAALAVALHFVRPFWLPQGGSINLEMLPIFFVAFRHGVWPGMTTGVIFGLLHLLIEPFIVHPAQLVLDYPLAFALVGLAGIFRSAKVGPVVLGTVVGAVARFLSHFVSGIVFFASYAPKGQPIWLYSLIYNGSYMLPSAILCLILVYPLLKGFERAKV